ncbi:MAG: adenosylmethionine decarboxylase [Pyrinomonadaceae bacterium]|nr:adenosylmethionine decarboxylase [Pyrinomonadaceae bacterium]MCX7639660.1 adenosylmethionine decarboxylase [Pyrinomonadaceae bacterium]MDW8303323.1 adenosylmethionine decarboxylase [Acidobacteriota bacterium]
MRVGFEWIIDAFDCDADKLRDMALLKEIFATLIEDLGLNVIEERWYQFPIEKGITGFALLSESHIACHTYPEFGITTFNLYCCNRRAEWNWEENLRKKLDAQKVKVTFLERGAVEARVS